MNTSANTGTAAAGEEATDAAGYLSGPHLAVLLGTDPTTPLSDVVGAERAAIIVAWQRDTLNNGRYLIDHNTGKPDLDPWVEDVPVIPVDVVAEALADHGVEVPTRQEVRDFADADGGTDPEIELLRARYVADPDLDAAGSTSEQRICGVPESIFNALDPDDQAKVLAGRVIAPPQAPTYVARWLVRNRYRVRLPLHTGNRRRRVWMRTLVRAGQTWYVYGRSSAGDPPRWIAKTDPEWMRAELRDALANLWYLKARTKDGDVIYDTLKAWNPDTRTLGMVEDALADELRADELADGLTACELPDVYGDRHGFYSGGTRALARNGVLHLETGALAQNTPLWFSLSRIEADYDHRADPYADTEWLRMLRTQWPDDPGAITCLQQWFGYVLSGRTDLQKWMLIIGPSGSGKSIIAEVLGALMGTVAATSLDELNGSFGLQALYETGAQLGVISDIRFSTRDSSTAVENLLGITGEDTLHIARKYKVTVAAKLGVRFHASANEIPRWSDNSGALQKRALLLETTRSFRGTAEEDPGLKKRILDNELGPVLRWAVEGLTLLDAAGGVFTQTQHADELAQEVNDKAAPVRRFITECCQIGTAEAHRHNRHCACEYVDSARLFTVWKAWAATNGHNPGSHVTFRSALKAMYADPIKPGQVDNGQRVVWGIASAATAYTDRGQYGIPVERTVSTANSGDPMGGGGSLN
ncbi:hypothetical protein MXEN_17033 [Mycobacterium xenopi RIVM700367]|uniref:DNA primase family protein n=1 Tax=Mycobacterium xenopi TaxID=1789 RepID=UPI00025AE947|nr:phage/plasmid primase, P4 family [Mycobacterium xenopi]EID10876.1 hypothetical protein MXEN_17033 [Mycobacterium xenopi RIVM700367]